MVCEKDKNTGRYIRIETYRKIKEAGKVLLEKGLHQNVIILITIYDAAIANA